MTAHGSTLRTALACATAAWAGLAAACTWTPWIPGERSWNPDPVVDPATLAQQLALDTPYVDTLDCYAQRCQKRFRVVLDEPGTLTVSAIPELAAADDQARLVLETPLGVLAQAASGRGPRSDVPVLSVREPVDAGTYFLLVQSLGGPVPYQLTATLTPGEGAAAAREAARAGEAATTARAGAPPAGARLAKPEGPEPRLTRVELPGRAGADFDPAVSFAALRSFRFPAPVRPGPDTPVGARLEQPVDRQIRRLLADDLMRKGLRQATGDEPADLLVDFSRGNTTRAYRPIPLIYSWYQLGPLEFASAAETNTRGTLTVDLIDLESHRIAWHAWTTKGLGPGVTYGTKSDALLREAVTELLSGFPPR